MKEMVHSGSIHFLNCSKDIVCLLQVIITGIIIIIIIIIIIMVFDKNIRRQTFEFTIIEETFLKNI